MPALVKSLRLPGNSDIYVNPVDQDHRVSTGDWVRGRPGVANASDVRWALDALIGRDITVPVWDQFSGTGANAQYRIAKFANIRLLNYRLPGQNRISVRFLGYNTVCSEGRSPVANDDRFTTLEDTPLEVQAPGVLANDSDPDHNTLRRYS